MADWCGHPWLKEKLVRQLSRLLRIGHGRPTRRAAGSLTNSRRSN
jgi:hypothetical protein